MGSPTRVSHGRGGAGNIHTDRKSPEVKPQDLETPHIKANTYTTGRGGSGNMAKNDPAHPEVARASQDVEAAPAHHQGPRQGQVHIGRGGAANIANANEKEGSIKEKGKALLGKMGIGSEKQ